MRDPGMSCVLENYALAAEVGVSVIAIVPDTRSRMEHLFGLRVCGPGREVMPALMFPCWISGSLVRFFGFFLCLFSLLRVVLDILMPRRRGQIRYASTRAISPHQLDHNGTVKAAHNNISYIVVQDHS